MTLWKFLHIACMFGAVSTTAGGGLFRRAILRSDDVLAIRRALAVERRVGNVVGGPLFVAGIAFGFVTAVTTGFDLTATWLVIAYVLVAVMLANGFVFHDPHAKKLEAAAESSETATPSPQLQSLIESPRTWLSSAIDSFLWVAIIFTMVVKPFS